MGETVTSWAWYVGSQSWRQAMCCAATEGVQISRIFSCKRLCGVQHKSLASKCPYNVVSLPLFVCLILHRYLSKREGCTVSSFLPLCPLFLSLANVSWGFDPLHSGWRSYGKAGFTVRLFHRLTDTSQPCMAVVFIGQGVLLVEISSQECSRGMRAWN